MRNLAIYPGTFDPITLGHQDIIERAAKAFDTLIIGVAANPKKSPLFTLPERVALIQAAVRNVKNIKVIGFEGLLIEFAHEQNARFIVRGLRAVSDFEFEFQLAAMNRQLAPEIETFFLPTNTHTSYISSSFVREVALYNGNVTPFVSEHVVQPLMQRIQKNKGG
ncbi:MAG: pantetheine-phosphate adenylyltransferase [Pseudomonadota bacterium]